MKNKLRQYSFIRLEDKSLIEKYSYPKEFKDDLIFFGDIPNMPGHCIVMTIEGKIFAGYHTDMFIELSKEET